MENGVETMLTQINVIRNWIYRVATTRQHDIELLATAMILMGLTMLLLTFGPLLVSCEP